MYETIIKVKDPDSKLEKVMELDDKEFTNKRAKYELKKEGSDLKIVVDAKDAVALRSILNTISKILDTYEKTSSIAKELK